MRILVTNDDGIDAHGLRSLEKELKETHEVLVCAPDREQSASSHSLSLTRPLRLDSRGENRWACDGTPTDSVLLAFHELFKASPPELIVSGINHGQNMGEDVTYSGTIAAAIEGAILGAPSLAVSLIQKNDSDHAEKSFSAVACFVSRFIERYRDLGIPKSTFLNLNFPDLEGAEYVSYQYTRLGLRVFNDVVIRKADPRGKSYYWIGGEADWQDIDGTDYAATHRGIVSITPLRVNFDDNTTLQRLGPDEIRKISD